VYNGQKQISIAIGVTGEQEHMKISIFEKFSSEKWAVRWLGLARGSDEA
jgi:hypothetical protein